jgi:hypothetical protein
LAAAPSFLVLLDLPYGALELDEGRGGRPGKRERAEIFFLVSFRRGKKSEESKTNEEKRAVEMKAVSSLHPFLT